MSINSSNKQFVIQLIQSTLAELGFDKLARQLGDSQNLIVNYKSSGPSTHPITQQDVDSINLFYDTIYKGNYLELAREIQKEAIQLEDHEKQSLLMAVDEQICYLKLLKPCSDSATALNLIQYLLKRTYFLELVLLYVIQSKSTSDFLQRLIEYSGPQLEEPLNTAYLVNFIKTELLELLETFQPKSASSPLWKCKNLFPHELLGNLTNNENEYIKLSSLVLRSETSSLLEMADLIFNQDYLLLGNMSFNNTVNVFDQLRAILKSKYLNQIFAFNKQFSQLAFPEGYLAQIIDQAVKYQHYKHPFYLPPRDSFNGGEPLEQPHLLIPQGTDEDLKRQFPDKLLHTLDHHTDEVWFTKFSPSGKYLATAPADGRVIIYDVRNEFAQLAVLESNTKYDKSRFVYNGITNSELSQLNLSHSQILYCCWDPTEEFIVTVGFNKLIRVWYVGLKKSIETPRRVTRSAAHLDAVIPRLASCFILGVNIRVWSVEFLPPSVQSIVPEFIVGSPDKALRAFDVNGKLIFDFYADTDENSELAILEEGDASNAEIASLGGTGDEGRASQEENTNSHVKASPSRTSISSQDKNIGSSGLRKLSTTSDATKYNDGEAGEENGHQAQFNRVNDLAITPCGGYLVTITANQQVDFFTLPHDMADASQTTRKLFSLTLTGRLTLCSISHSGKYLLVNLGPENLFLWDILCLPEKPILVRKLVGHSQDSNVVRSLFGYLADEGQGPEEQLVLSGSDDGYVYIWKIKTGELISRVKAHCGLCNSVDWNLYGDTLGDTDYGKLWCSVGDDKLVKIWGPQLD